MCKRQNRAKINQRARIELRMRPTTFYNDYGNMVHTHTHTHEHSKKIRVLNMLFLLFYDYSTLPRALPGLSLTMSPG